ncbi:dTDP-glucose 4,6-dehydratase [Alicyclobacillus fastidiosus]|uniref:dTDP-glucose 4,6-dehydratase n=1 Tax=Alicyclobacillus fastidiosus TaxID=392011 RepID=A0ABY6ZMX0_9BACL|nr:dTDP-glucose 4,6-dehydratase [Alicyclobacillus fastidiosus]WAH43822.1 dTDP-glucose 4,6-dehydratase [Alicyclobacillus fastidiosus]GMA60053.1 dTDP-glucose 4,6-dehydratase [Alicyclobacillus fastidiosus]
MKLLVTGGAGFIGSNFIHYILKKYPSYVVINLDKPTYAGNFESLSDVENNRNYYVITGDITSPTHVEAVFQNGIDVVVHFAAESHVDRSILNPNVFFQTNVLGTQYLVEFAKQYKVKKFVQISTDEVYGSLGQTGRFTEATQLQPNSPYSASKASADLLVRAYYETFGIPVNITRCSNNYGPFQFPEKLIPLSIIRAMNDESIPLYGSGLQVRDWLHVDDHCRAIDLVIHHGVPGEIYNIGANNEWTNVDLIKEILDKLHKPYDLIHFVKDRPGHDQRYAIDASKIKRDLGWTPRITFEEGLSETIEWYLDHEFWWKRVQEGEYRSYMALQYGHRLDGLL